ncbi:hypothetical protein HRbin17_01301 [bacterium HR17]|uniref:Uncharacterized protein n=1 Tax=Candidatus Fervidibacter japonicus TaxID=2035412 RepID=A0A2H5XCD8_9BACT|nr:hypothetical protein HRbin17_01301 [bacterium HR17]
MLRHLLPDLTLTAGIVLIVMANVQKLGEFKKHAGA